ncbi:hypothetical protein NN3_15020 [Nocardia neocaledoniensis NBRC 108232]|nr:hypothetical protein NN3_15020 [Nocardia neocaledoniensis NBRC 108232]
MPVGIGDRLGRLAGQVELVDAHLASARGGQALARGQHAHRLRGVEDVLDALGRVIGVQRHVRATGGGHGVHADQQVDRAPHAEGHIGFRSDAGVLEPARQLAHADRELGVGQTRPLEGERGRVGRARDLRLEESVEGGRIVVTGGAQRGVDGEFGVVPAVEHQGALGGVEQFDVADGDRRIGDDTLEHAQQARAERRGVACVEKVGGVDEFGVEVAVALGRDLAERELQVEFGHVLVDAQLGDGQAGQFQGGAAQVLEREHHLEQRVARLRARRVEHLDEALERHVGVREGRQIVLADLAEQLGEAGGRIDLGAQHQGVDEHADQVVERLLATTGHRDADGDVLGARQPRQQRGEGAVHHHEQRGAVFVGDPVERVDQLARHLEAVRTRLVGGLRRARLVAQAQLVGQVGQRTAPVVELLGDQRGGIGLVAEGLALPQRVVDVLDGQRRPARLGVAGAGDVGGHQVAHQRAQREAVGGDVVDHHHQHVLALAQLVDAQAHRRVRGDVETAAGELVQRGRHVGLVGLDEFELGDGNGSGQHLLVGGAVVRGVDRAQRFVPGDHVGDRAAQGGQVEQALQADRDRDVVGARVTVVAQVEAVEEPHPLLGQRQRRMLRPRSGGELGAHAGARVRLHPRGERADGGRLEQGAHAHLGVECLAQAGRDLGGDQRVAAEGEEVVVHAHALGAEQIGEDLGHDLLDRGRGRPEHLGLEHRRGQRLAVELAGGVERELVEHHQRRGHHVGGQLVGQPGLDRGDVDARIRFGHQVTDELVTGVRVGAHHDDRLRDARLGQQRRLDLAELDAQTAQLHLEVGAAQVVQFPVARPGDEVAGAVHPRTGGAVRVGDETVGGEVGPVQVADGELIARQVQLTRDTGCHRVQARIQHEHLGVPHRATDRHRLHVGVDDLVIGDVDRGLGGAVQVVQARAGELAQALRGGRGQRLTGGEHLAQAHRVAVAVVAEGGHEHRQHRRHEVRGGDVAFGDDLRQVHRIAVAVGLGHDQARAGLQGPEELPHRHIEGGGGLLQHGVGGVDRVLVLHPQQAVDDRRVIDGHALGAAGRARGEDHVGGVGGPQRTDPVGIGDRRAAEIGGQLDVLDRDDGHAVGVERVAAAGEDQARRGGLEDVADAVGGLVRVERHVRRARLQHRVHGDDQFGGTPDRQRHMVAGADAVGDELAGDAVGPLLQIAVGQFLLLEDQRDGVGGPLDLRVEQRDQGARGHLTRGVVPVDEDLGVLLGREQIDVADRHLGIGGDRGEDVVQPARERGDRGLLEKVTRVGELGRHAAGLAVGVLHLGEGELQIELGELGVVVDAAHRQTRQLQRGLLVVLERQHHLEQRMTRLRPRRVEHLDEPLERHVGVRERLQVGLAGLVEQGRERRGALDLRTQHQGVDEHADQVVERLVATACHRGADGDVAGAAGPGEQHGQRAVHDHEQRRVVAAAQFHQGALGLAGDDEAVGAAAVGRHRRARVIGGQHQLVGQIGEFACPVVDLGGDQRLRVVLGAEHLALPQRVIGVLDRQFGPGRRLPRGARGVGHDDIARQRRHRPAVGGDVVHHHAEHVLGLADLEKPCVQRHFAGHVEGHRGQVDQVVDEVVLGDPVRRQVGDDLRGVEHHLHRAAARLGEHGAQRLVPIDHVDDGDLQRGHVELAGQADGDRDVVDRGGRVETVQEPHALLGQRQRHPLGPLAGHQRLAGAVTGLRFHPRGQRRDGRGLEQHAHRDPGVQGDADAGGDLGGDQRVAAQLEEVVLDTDAREFEHVGEDLGHDLLDRGGRGAELAHLEHRRRQRAPVELAVDGQRDRGEHHDRRGHHVRRKALRHMVGQFGDVDRAAGHGHHVGHQRGAAALVLVPDADREIDGLVRGQRGVDLAELDTETADLHLEVGAADVFDIAVGGPAHHVTGAVHPLAGRVRVGHEAVGGERGARVVAARHADAADVELTGHAHRYRAQAVVEDQRVHAADRAADDDPLAGDQALGQVGGDGGLGGAVDVAEHAARAVGQGHRPLAHQLRRDRLATGREHPQVIEAAGVEGGQRGRGDEGVGDLLGDEDVAQFLTAVHAGRNHDQGAAAADREQHLEHRRVERRRGEMQCAGVGVEGVQVDLLGAEVGDAGMGHHDALGHTGGTGGVDQVGGLGRIGRAHQLARGQRGVGEVVQVDVVDLEPAHRGR